MSQHAGPLAAAPFEWQKAAPADVGFAPDLEARLDRLITSGRAWMLDGVVVARHGKLVLDPLGIGPTEWNKGFNGEPAPSSGLCMTPRDLARIGQLILNRGRWDGRQVVAAEWLDQSFRPYVACDEQRRYGYFWYSGDFQYGNPPNRPIAHWVGAFGYGGQRLFVLPEFDIVVAITAGNYADERQWIPPIRVIREVVLPSLS
jgi:CubicO group peptidase (beta-lactamase class C family)